MRAMVLSAGYGTRMGDLTREMPKPMLLIEGRPILEYIICHLARQGFVQIAINLHFKPEIVQNYFRDGSKWRVNITYSYEPELLGTAGGVKKWLIFYVKMRLSWFIMGMYSPIKIFGQCLSFIIKSRLWQLCFCINVLTRIALSAWMKKDELHAF